MTRVRRFPQFAWKAEKKRELPAEIYRAERSPCGYRAASSKGGRL